MNEVLYTTGATARQLGLSVAHVRKLAAAGQLLVAFKTSDGDWLFDQEAIAILARQRAAARRRGRRKRVPACAPAV